jgi:ABC-type protease/lipase transport system fused ATPase/permease subunit
MIAATILLPRALQPVELLITGWKSLVEARGAWQRLRGVSDAGHAADRVALPAPVGRLELERVVFGELPERAPIIKGVSFMLQPGETVGLIGPSASGKTTLARLILGIWSPGSGVVRLDGADVTQWDRRALGAHVGYLPQTIELFAGTVAENICRLGTMDSEAVVRAARQAGAHELILRLPQGYDTPVGDDGGRLSGGQRQRIALARAVYGSPALAVLDEADASLDAEGEQALLECVRRLKAQGTTVIVVSQRRAVLGVADLVAVMKDGKIERLAAREPAAPVAVVAGAARGNPA